jgi:hypothetical protein
MSDADLLDWIAYFLCEDEDEEARWRRRNGIEE